jgi:Lamin Tail Domain
VGHTYRARVRHKDNTGRWSYWSEPVQFTASLPSVAAYQDALRITEINYNPCAVTPAELAAPGWNVTWNEQDFEFIELRNVSATAIDLTDVRFTQGFDFDFAPAFSLAAGQSAVIVKNPAAFAIRYPSVTPVGSYGTANLSNGGETVKLSFGNGTAIFEFAYDDAAPWPTTPDGTGPTLVLRDPAKPGLNHGDPAEWRASYLPKGNPGGHDLMTYAIWALSNPSAAGPGTDEDKDGFDNRLEYALSGDVSNSSTQRSPEAQFVTVSGSTYAQLTFTRRTEAGDVTFDVQFSHELVTWDIDGAIISSTVNNDGTTTQVWRSVDPVSARDRLFGRVEVTPVP